MQCAGAHVTLQPAIAFLMVSCISLALLLNGKYSTGGNSIATSPITSLKQILLFFLCFHGKSNFLILIIGAVSRHDHGLENVWSIKIGKYLQLFLENTISSIRGPSPRQKIKNRSKMGFCFTLRFEYLTHDVNVALKYIAVWKAFGIGKPGPGTSNTLKPVTSLERTLIRAVTLAGESLAAKVSCKSLWPPSSRSFLPVVHALTKARPS